MSLASFGNTWARFFYGKLSIIMFGEDALFLYMLA